MTSTTGRTEPHRSGFTLLELLVVLGIFALIAGVAWAGLIGARRTAGLTGAAQMISGFARQAHATALSSGAPVQVLIDADRLTVSGVSQTPLIWDAFEGVSPSPGFAGAGLVLNHPSPGVFPSDADGDGNGIADWGTAADRSNVEARWFRNLPTNQALVRNPSDGFYLSCWIKPPPAKDAGAGAIIPLVLIGREGAGETGIAPNPNIGSPDAEIAYVGLTLELELLEVQINQSTAVTVPHWVPVAWIQTDTYGADPDAYLRMVGVHIPDGTVDALAFHPSVIPAWASGSDQARDVAAPIYPVAQPIVGDGWVQLGLLYDGERLAIYNGEVEVTRKDEGVVGPLSDALLAEIRDDPNDVRCYLGRGTFRVSDAGMNSGDVILGQGMIDELRVVRIGTDRPQRLPAGITLDQHYRILSADGSVSLFARADPADPWVRTTDPMGLNAVDGTTAAITVAADGTTELSYGAPP